MSVYPKYSKL